MSECVKKSAAWARCLEDRAWDLVRQLGQAPADVQGRAAPILADLRQALSHDDHVATTPLADVLDAAYQRLLGVFVHAPAAGTAAGGTETGTVQPADPLAGVTVRPAAGTTAPGGKAAAAKVPATGEEKGLTPDSARNRIEEIRCAHPGAEIEVSIRWSGGG